MLHEQEIERAEQIEAALRKAVVPVERKRPDPSQTYFGRSMMGLDGDAAIGTENAYVVGSQPQVNADLPAPNYSVDNNLEPALGISIEELSDTLTEPYANTAYLPPPAVECPYAIAEGCHLEAQEIGPCLCFKQSTPLQGS